MKFKDFKNYSNSNLGCATDVVKPTFSMRSNIIEQMDTCSQGCFCLTYFYRKYFLIS
jgi:hypothetical protein